MVSASPLMREEAIVQRLREQYQHQGFQFFEYPSRDLVPPFLGSYRPDAIALRPGHNIAIEVKSRATPSGKNTLAKIARLFEGHPDWEFRVFVADGAEVDEELAPAERQDLVKAIEEAKVLAQNGHVRPALILGWSVLEGYARLMNQDDSESVFGPQQAVQWLTAQGHIDQRTSKVISRLIPARNAFVHGDLSKSVADPEVRDMLERVSELLRNE